jgi:hypothetical protein
MKKIMEVTSLSASIHTTRKNILARVKAIAETVSEAKIPAGVRVARSIYSGDNGDYRLAISGDFSVHVTRDEGYGQIVQSWDNVPTWLLRTVALVLPSMVDDIVRELKEAEKNHTEALEKILK